MTNEQLLVKLAENPQLPTPPGLALQVLERVSRPDCTLEEVGRLISHDPSLCSNILKTVNSALFGLPRTISSIDRALKLLGLKTVRSLVLGLSLPAMHCRTIPADRMRDYWRSSVAGAIAARELALKLRRPDPEDDLVAGLLRDLGMLVLHQEKSELYANLLAQPPEVLARSQCELEEQLFGVNHAEVSAYLLRRWRLPEDVTEPIRLHHNLAQIKVSRGPVAERAFLLHFATRVTELQLAPAESANSMEVESCSSVVSLAPGSMKDAAMAQAQSAREILELARTHLGMTEQQLHEYLDPLHTKMQEFASFMNVDIGKCDNYSLILAQATEELLKLAVESTVDHRRVVQEKSEAQQEAEHWRQTAHHVHREAIRDGLTGTYNRAYFEESLAVTFKLARRRCQIMGLIFIDLDGFKKLNDSFGHPFGDQVLKEVGGLLRREVRGGDIAARYGGDEFVIIVSDTSDSGLQALANRLWKAINALKVEQNGNVGSVGASIGAVLCFPHRTRYTTEQFLAAADKAMYTAKAAGKNRVTVQSLLADEDRRLIDAVRQLMYSVQLVESGKVSAAEVQEAVRMSSSSSSCLGRLARKLGWLSASELANILVEQRRSRSLLGDIAVARGNLTQAQVYALLALQRERPEGVAEALVDMGILTDEESRQDLAEYYQRIQSLNVSRASIRASRPAKAS